MGEGGGGRGVIRKEGGKGGRTDERMLVQAAREEVGEGRRERKDVNIIALEFNCYTPKLIHLSFNATL